MAEPLTSDDPRQVASYQVRARLGAGGMGQVYLAITPAGRRVALKMVRAEYGDDERFRARFRQEVSAAQRVHGLFTAQVLDADPDAPQPWLATSYVPGLSLRQAVIEFGPLPPATVVLLIAGIAEALQAIHAAGVVHRDLKPANVILAADGPRVIDFGIAQAAAAPSLTQGGSRVGSPRFMAPEQARSQATTPAVDVFALGSLATYACAGHPPFGSDHALAVLGRVLHDPPDLDGCPPELRGLIERCLDKDPGRRPPPGDIIEACRTMAGGALSFERPWLPEAISAAAAAAEVIVGPPAPAPGTEPAPQRKPGRSGLEPAGPEWTMASEASRDAGWAAGPGTGSGPIRDPAEPASGAAVPLAGTGLAGWALAGGAAKLAAESGPGTAGAQPGGTGASSPGAAGAQPGGTGAASARLHRRPGKAAAAVTGAAALVLAAGAASVATLASSGSHLPTAGQHSQHSQHAGALPSAAPSLRAKVRRPMTRRATPDPPGQPSVIPSTTAQVTRPRSSPSHRANASPSPRKSTPAPEPTAGSPSPSPSPTGQAAFGGTWDGTVLQPGWTAPTWELQLDIPADGTWGSYSAPSLGCSGTVRVTGIAGGTMTAKARTTSPVYPGCVKSARLIITLGALGDLDLTWTPGNGKKPTGTAVLVSS